MSSKHCVLIVFRLNAMDADCGCDICTGAALVADLSDDRLLGTSSMDAFCDNAKIEMFELMVISLPIKRRWKK